MTNSVSDGRHRPWLSWRPVLDAPVRLICFPHAGAAASTYRPWIGRLGADVEVLAPQLPGRETRLAEPPIDDLDQLVDATVVGIAAYLEPPFALFGHSFGALLAFELCRKLVATDAPLPSLLFVSAFPAPQHALANRCVHRLSDDELLEETRSYAGTPEVVLADPELSRMLLPVIRADFKVCETYEYRQTAPLPVEIVAFAGDDDPEASPEMMAAWHEQTAARFSLHRLHGNHFFVLESRDEVIDLVAQRCLQLVPVRSADAANDRTPE